MLTERNFGVLNCLCSFRATQNQPKMPTLTLLQTPYLGADLGRNADKLRVGCECGQVLHGFDQGGGGDATLIAVVFREIPVQGLMGGNMETLSH